MLDKIFWYKYLIGRKVST